MKKNIINGVYVLLAYLVFSCTGIEIEDQINVDVISAFQTRVKFVSTIPTDAVVKYWQLNSNDTLEVRSEDQDTNHRIDLLNLQNNICEILKLKIRN